MDTVVGSSDFFRARSVFLYPVSAAALWYNAGWPCCNGTTTGIHVSGRQDIPAHLPIHITRATGKLTPGHEQPEECVIPFTPCGGTTTIHSRTGNVTQSTGSPVAWVNTPGHARTTGRVASLHYGVSPLSARHNAEEVFSQIDPFFKVNDPSRGINTGTAIRKELK